MKKSLLLTVLIMLFSFSLLAQEVLVIVDGKKSKSDVNSIDPNTIESVSVLKDQAAIHAYGKAGKHGVIVITTKNSNGSIVTRPKPMVIVDGETYTEGITSIDPNNIKYVSVFKDQAAIEKYGDAGKNGVIVITTLKIKDK